VATDSSVSTPVDVLVDDRIRHSSRLQRWLEMPALWIAAVDVCLILLFGLISPNHVFFNTSNFTNMALDSAEVVLLAVGIAFLLGAGELDISIGANVILASVLGGKTMVALSGSASELGFGHYPHLAKALTIGIAVCLLSGIGFGLVNAFIVTGLGVNSFIATLGTLGIGTGVAFVVANGNNIQNIPTSFQSAFGVRTVFNIPLPALVTIILVALLWGLLALTRYGLHTLAIGSSRQAAERAGIPITWHLVSLFALVGLLAGVAGVYDLARFSTTNISGHQTEALSAIAGAVIGGTNLFGGRVSIPGAVFGAVLAVILETGLVIQGLSPFYQLIVVGVVLIFAVFIRGVELRGFSTKISRKVAGRGARKGQPQAGNRR
jgi:ribose transport system permease protein